MSVPTQAEVLMRILHHIDEIQSDCATYAHLTRSMSSSAKDAALADGWIALSEMFKRVRHQVVEIAKGKLQ